MAWDASDALLVRLLASHLLNLGREVVLRALLLNLLFPLLSASPLAHSKVDRHGGDQEHDDGRYQHGDDGDGAPRRQHQNRRCDHRHDVAGLVMSGST